MNDSMVVNTLLMFYSNCLTLVLSLQLISRQICVSSAAWRKNLAAAGPEKFSEEYIKKQIDEFNIGKRHLANMMGEDPETFTQEDIDVRRKLLL